MAFRIEYIDFVKGLTMYLVILGHVNSTPTLIRSSIYSFHMPLFFIISGLFFNIYKKSLSKDFRSLVIPYIVVGGVILICKIISCGFHDENYLCNYLSFILVEFKFHNMDLCGGAIWFLVVLFFCKLYLRIIWNGNYSTLFLVIGAFFSMMLTKITTIVVPFGFSQALVCSSFVLIGFKFRDFIIMDKFSKFIKRINLPVSYTLFFLLSIMMLFSFHFAVATRINSYRFGLLNIIMSSLLSILIILSIKNIYERGNLPLLSKVLCWAGKYSIIILAVHSIEIELLDLIGKSLLLSLPFYVEFLIRVLYITVISWLLVKIALIKKVFNIKLEK